MIRIQLKTDSSDRLIGLQASGHSNLANKGNDILCAAVSALLENLAAGLEEVVKSATVERGNEFKIEIDPNSATELLCATTLLSLRRLQEQYVDRIQIVMVDLQ